MPNFLEYLRQQNIFGSRPPMIGNDLPQQGGITGRMPYDPNAAMGMQFPGVEATPPPVNIPGITGVGQTPDPRLDPMFSVGPFEPQQFNLRSSDIEMPTPGQGQPEMDAGQRMRELYNPSDDASRRFEEMINQYPQEKRPGWLQGIGSLLQEFAYGPNVADRTRERWRNEPIEDWKNKIGPMQQAATNERYENVNARTLAYQQMSTELRERAQIAKEKNDERKAAIQQQRADIYAYKARNPDKKFLMPKGGNVQVFDPRTGQTFDTGVPTGSMTDLDRLHLEQENALERIGETGYQARETEGVRQQGREAIQETRGWKLGIDQETGKSILYNEITGATKPVSGNINVTPTTGASTAKPESPTQTKVRIYNKAQQLRNTRPDLAKYIKLGVTGTNDVEVVKPSTGGWFSSGPTQDQYDEISKFLYGQAVGPANTPPGGKAGTGSKVPLTQAPPAPAGWRYVRKGNRWVAVPDNEEEGKGEVF